MADDDSLEDLFPNQEFSSSSRPTYTSAPVVSPISVPILRSIYPVKVSVFIHERKRYEIEEELEAAEVPSLKDTPYNMAIERALLKQLIFVKTLRDFTPEATVKT